MATRMLAVVAFLSILSFARSQDAEPEKVRFTTCDGVTLRGQYYAGKGQDWPAVMILHELGEKRREKNVQKLAAALQKAGYAVLAFDFRGHGDSTEVDPDEFWSNRYINRSLVRGQVRGDIDFKDFDPRYYPVLVNDIAAAKACLDRRNDAQACNSSNLVVIGMERGATLGAIWVNSEFSRYELTPPKFVNQPPQVSNTSEGKKILAAVWLSIEPTLGNREARIPSLVDAPGRTGKLPTVFFHADGDTEGARIASECEKSLHRGAKLPFTGKAVIPDAGERKGADLLNAAGTQGAIVEYIENVRKDRAAEWMEHDFREKQYAWRLPRGLLSANRIGDLHLNFGTYEAFLPAR